MTDMQRQNLVELSDSESRHMRNTNTAVLSANFRNDLIRCDCAYGPLSERIWTITPKGIEALEASQ